MTRLERKSEERKRGTEVKRETPLGDYVVELTVDGVRIKEKRRRKWFGPISYGALYVELAWREADARRRAKAKARKEAKEARGPRGKRRK